MTFNALRDVRVELAIETGRIRARVFPDFGKEQCVESSPLGAVGATPRFWHEGFIVFRKRHGFETEIDVLLNPRLQTADGNETPLCVVCGVVAVKTTAQGLVLHFRSQLGDEERMLDAPRREGSGHRWNQVQEAKALGDMRGSLPGFRRDLLDRVPGPFAFE